MRQTETQKLFGGDCNHPDTAASLQYTIRELLDSHDIRIVIARGQRHLLKSKSNYEAALGFLGYLDNVKSEVLTSETRTFISQADSVKHMLVPVSASDDIDEQPAESLDACLARRNEAIHPQPVVTKPTTGTTVPTGLPCTPRHLRSSRLDGPLQPPFLR